MRWRRLFGVSERGRGEGVLPAEVLLTTSFRAVTTCSYLSTCIHASGTLEGILLHARRQRLASIRDPCRCWLVSVSSHGCRTHVIARAKSMHTLPYYCIYLRTLLASPIATSSPQTCLLEESHWLSPTGRLVCACMCSCSVASSPGQLVPMTQ